MNDGFKQRLVGAIVLTCLALIVWPVLFSNTTGPAMDRRSQIPSMPEFQKYDVPEPVRPANVTPVADAVVEQKAPDDQAPVAAKPKASTPKASAPPPDAASEKPKLDSQGLPQGWVLQVASFSQLRNAEELKAQLQTLGYKAYTRRLATSGGTVARVYIGPKMSKQAFDKDRSIIDRKFKVKSIVVKFEQ